MLDLDIDVLSIEPGKKFSGYVPVVGGGARIPATIICGERPGGTCLISGGVHSAEYVGIQTALELADRISPAELTGNLIIIRLMNPTGFERRTMSVVYEDGLNLNRVFPGRPDGSLAERTAYTVVEKFQRRADYYIDLHGGDSYEAMTPYVYCQGAAAPEVTARSRAMAEVVDVPYLVRSPLDTGGAYNYAGRLGIPGILIERGGRGFWSRAEVDQYKADVCNVLRHLSILEGEVSARARRPQDVGQIVYAEAGFTGCWYPTGAPGDFCRAGDILGTIKDYFGQTLESCRAETDGVRLYQTSSLCILKGEVMVAYGERPRD